MPFHISDATCATTLQDYSEATVQSYWSELFGRQRAQAANSEPITMTARGTVNLHTEHWCTVQKGGDGVKKNKTKKKQHSRHMHSLQSVFYHTSLWSQLWLHRWGGCKTWDFSLWPLSSFVTGTIWSFRDGEWKCSESKRRGYNKRIESRRRGCAELNK